MAQTPQGAFSPSTFIWDMDLLKDMQLDSPQFKDLLVRLHQYINLIAINANNKDSGVYDVIETVNGQQFFVNEANTQSSIAFRPAYRKVIYYTSALPNTGSVNIPHGLSLNSSCTITRMYGVANDPSTNSALPLPFASPTLANNISIEVNGSNIVLTTGSNRSAYTYTYIIIELLQEL